MRASSIKRLKDKYAIVGIGYTPQGRVAGRSALSFCIEASVNAIKDAGLSKEEIDGLLCYRRFEPLNDETEVTPYVLAQQLGIQPTIAAQEANCARHHLAQAVSLLEAGFCNYVLIVYGDNPLSGRRRFLSETTHAEPFADCSAFGLFGPVACYALAARRAMHEFATGPDTWKEIAVNQRRWANLNPAAAMYRKTLTREEYATAPYLVEPFRLFDACLVGDGGRACIITSTDRAKDLRHPVVSIMGLGLANPCVDINQSTAMHGPTGAKDAGLMAFQMAGITTRDVDAWEIYDCFTYTVEITLQDYGLFGPGEGKGFFENGRTAPGGPVPVNTSGGLLSEAYLMGLTPLAEGVMQLMGRCGERQLGAGTGTDMPQIILCSDNGGVLQTHSTVILRRH